MNLYAEIATLILKEFKLEFRNKSSISSMMLYVISTVFVCYQSFKIIEEVTVWNSLFWIIILFASVNAVNKTFYHETRGQQYYYYQLVKPEALILSKIIYNIFLMLILSIISFVVYSLVLGSLISDHFQFLVVLFLGSVGISSILTLVSGIASKSNNNIGLTAILALPIMIPLLITIIAASKHVADGLDLGSNLRFIGTLLGIDLLVIALAFVLFPYIWKE